MPRCCRYAFALLIAALLVSALPAFGDAVFTDSFGSLTDLSNYTVTGPNTSAGWTISDALCTTCGEGSGVGLQVLVGVPVPSAAGQFASVVLVNNTFSYDPSTEGAIAYIDASVNHDFTVSTPNGTIPGVTGSVTFTTGFRPVIEQDGNLYVALISGPDVTASGTDNLAGTTGFVTDSGDNLTASDFLLYDPSTGTFSAANPNFSGDPMLFGLADVFTSGGLSATPGFTIDLESDFNSLAIDVSTNAPEPSSLLLLFVGLGALLGLRFFSRKRLSRSHATAI